MSKQRGFAMIGVLIIGTIAMFIVSGMVGDDAVMERRAQDEELLRLRAYWAAQGHLSYAISRMAKGPPCGGVCDQGADRENAFVGFFSELETSAGVREWDYPEISPSYTFPVAVSAGFNSPFVTASVSFPAASTTHPLIGGVWPVRRDFAVAICSGVATSGDKCPVTFDDLENSSGISFIANGGPSS